MLLLKQILLKGIICRGKLIAQMHTVKQDLGPSLAFSWGTTVLPPWGSSSAYYFFIKKLHDKYGIAVLLPSLEQVVM